MFKLNNKGWGLSVLIAFIVILVIFILLIGMNANNLGIN